MPAVMSVGTMARNDMTVKVDAEIGRIAGMVAKARRIDLAEYVTEILRGVVYEDLERETGMILEKKPAPPKQRRRKPSE